MRLNQYFKRSEFACKCGCGYDTIDAMTLELLTNVREHFGKTINVSSGFRCARHNKAVGGAKKSYHLSGKAADISSPDVAPSEMYLYLCEKFKSQFGFILYDTFVHVDSRDATYRSSTQN